MRYDYNLNGKSNGLLFSLKGLLVLGMCVLMGVKSYAQQYSFEVSTSTYSNLEGSISLNNGEIWDDPTYEIPLGFDFELFDYVLSEVLIDGEFGTGGLITAPTGRIGLVSIIEPYSPDLVDRGTHSLDSITPASESNISYLVEGEVGSRIAKIEWRNAGFYGDVAENGVSTDYVNFQLWLHEGSNALEIHYGPNSISEPALVFDGEPGPGVGLIEYINMGTGDFGEISVLIGDPTNPMVSGYDINDTSATSSVTGSIPDGTVYRFTKNTLGLESNEIEGLSIYPNPVQDQLHISWADYNGEPVEVEVFDAVGKQVLYCNYYNGTDYVNCKDLNDGIYTIVVTSDNKATTKKFIKH